MNLDSGSGSFVFLIQTTMKSQRILTFSLFLLFLIFTGAVNGQKLMSYVDTRVGSAASIVHDAGAFGAGTEELAQTIPAVLVPNGMNFWTPQTQDTERKCVAPYYYKDSLLQGFRNSHWIVGGCTQDYGSMTLMPVSGTLKCQPAARASRFSHAKETATPAYYSAYLEDYRVKAEMTGTSRAAIFRFTYEQDEAFLVVNPNSDEGEGFIEIDPEKKEIRGYNPVHRIYQGGGKYAGFKGYFVVRFKDVFLSYGTYEKESVAEGNKQTSGKRYIGGYVKLKLPRDKKVMVKVGSSFTGMDAARANLEEEIADWNFQKVRSVLEKVWEKKLSTITVRTTDETAKRKFYGSLYRASFLPHAINDADGSYPAFSAGEPVMKMKSGNYYEDFSMWDTYRALHPLLNIIAPQLNGEMMQSLALKYEQGGWMPIFPCWNSYTAAMIGDHCVATLADAYVKGVRNFDYRAAYEGARKNAFTSPDDVADYKNGMGRRALASYLKHGYIPLEDEVPDAFHRREQVSRTLEYAFDDYTLAQWADSLGKTDDYKQLIKRAGNYKNVIDPSTGWARGRYADGRFIEPFAPLKFQFYITEGTPCHYTWYVPQDVYGLMKVMGGRKAYTQKLDSMFSERLYWHGNEPCHQIPFLFNYAGEPWKTQQQVRHIMESQYMEAPGGLSGNDDAGQMSAWYIFASLGFYPVCPGTPYYIIASPSFEKAVIRLENGKNFTVVARGASARNVYIQSVTLNGTEYTKNYFSHQDIVKGGVLEFVMGDRPNKEWGSKKEDCPPADRDLQLDSGL